MIRVCSGPVEALVVTLDAEGRPIPGTASRYTAQWNPLPAAIGSPGIVHGRCPDPPATAAP